MKSKKLTFISTVIGLLMVVAAVILTRSKPPGTNATLSDAVSQRVIAASELAGADGKDGHSCWVAVDGVVYEISNSPDWQNGEHTRSDGQAYCGADMSQVIDKAPHGRTMLDQLIVVGTYKN